MHVTGGKSLLVLKVFQHKETFQAAQCALPLQQFAADHDSDESEELTLELSECGEGGDAGDMARIGAGRHVTKRG